ncbi:Gfo/Idh/MocA family protein [Microbacterium sp. A588]
MQPLSPESPPQTVGLIGAGRMAAIHASAWSKLGIGMAVFSTDGAEHLAGAQNMIVVETIDELLERSDVIDIVSPSDTHAAYALRAIAAGRDVVCEKPLALSTADAHAIAAAAAVARTRVFPAHVARFTRPNAAARSAVAKGRIGTVAVSRFHRAAAAPAADTWFARPHQSGGIVFDLLLHDLDQARWFCGDVTSVFAAQSLDRVGGAITGAHATLTHASGAISQVTATWAAPGSRFRASFAIAGERGTLRYDSAARRNIVVDPARVDYQPGTRGQPNPYLAELSHFLDLRTGTPAKVGIDDGIEAVRLAEAAVASIASGEPVLLSPMTYAKDA